MGWMDLSLDGVYRAVSRGLQYGLGSTLIFLTIKTVFTLPGLEPISALAAFLTFTIISTALAFYRDTLRISLKGKAVLITGCDSGFGYELALRLERMLDVTSESQIAAAVEYVNRHLPPKGLWGIVNNAGLSTFGYVEWVPISTCKKLMEVNVWGMIRIIQAFLPFVRQSKGRVVNMSSGLSRFSFPNRSTYGITKYGVQSLSDCLRYEMKRWGVNVSVIEPGNFVNATGIFTTDVIRKQAAELWEQIPDPIKKDYTKEFYDNLVHNMIKYSTVGTTQKTPVLDAYTLALVHRFPHPRYQPMEPKMKLMAWVNSHCPEWYYEKSAVIFSWWELEDSDAYLFLLSVQSAEMDFSLDSIHRSVVNGIQVGLVTVGLCWTSYIVLGVSPFCTCLAFIIGTLCGTISLHGKGIVITGCDSGFGHALAIRLAKQGAVVFAGCLRSQEEGANSLRDTSLKNLHVVQMDITSDKEMNEALDYITKHLPVHGLWGIVNNAGWSTFGHVEWVPISVCKKSLEVNVWGMMRVIQTFLPLIRKSNGRIVNMSSGMGRRCAPGRASYCITKYGVEALSDSLRFEMRRWGVNVVIVEPGNFVNATGVFTPDSIRRDASKLWAQIPEQIQKDYSEQFFNNYVNNMIKYSTLGTKDKEPVLDALTKALVHLYPHPRYQPMELQFKLSVWANTHLPEWIFEALFT
ncbi:hypothetical protein C0J52_09864 [Blattella germanica]|nr:hypothetical protein C0J52_09864 [Blattella germanica]